MIRIDDRLLHGQVIWGWIVTDNYNNIIIPLSNPDESWLILAKQIVPEDIELIVLDMKNIDINKLTNYAKDTNNFILIKNINEMYSLYKKGFLPETVVIGGLHPQNDIINTKIHFANLTNNDIELLNKMKKDIKFIFQDLPSNSPITLDTIL